MVINSDFRSEHAVPGKLQNIVAPTERGQLDTMVPLSPACGSMTK